MATEVEKTPLRVPRPGLKRGWLREKQEAIRARGNMPITFTPVKIEGEPLSVTIIRERRGDFDD